MLKFMKNFFGFGAAEPTAAPYKVEAPVVNATPVVNTPQPMVNGRKPVKPAPARATGNVPAKKAVAKPAPAKKAVAKPTAPRKAPTKKK